MQALLLVKDRVRFRKLVVQLSQLAEHQKLEELLLVPVRALLQSLEPNRLVRVQDRVQLVRLELNLQVEHQRLEVLVPVRAQLQSQVQEQTRFQNPELNQQEVLALAQFLRLELEPQVANQKLEEQPPKMLLT